MILNFPVSFGKTPALGCSTVHGTGSSDIHWMSQTPGIVTTRVPAKNLDVSQSVQLVSLGCLGPRFLVMFFNVNCLYVTVLIIICSAATQNFSSTGKPHISKFLFVLEWKILVKEKFQKTSFWKSWNDFIIRITYIHIVRDIWLYFPVCPSRLLR